MYYIAVFFKHLCAYESSEDLVKNAHSFDSVVQDSLYLPSF